MAMATTPMTPVSERHQERFEGDKGKTPLALRDWLFRPSPPIVSQNENVPEPSVVAPKEPSHSGEPPKQDGIDKDASACTKEPSHSKQPSHYEEPPKQDEIDEDASVCSWHLPDITHQHVDPDSCVSVVDSSELQASPASINPAIDHQATFENEGTGEKNISSTIRLLEYMRDWVRNAAQEPPNNPLKELSANEYSCDCDLDTETGKLLPEVDYPPTIISLEVPSDENVAWRQVMASSSLHIQRAVEELNSGKEGAIQKQEEPIPSIQEDQPPPFAECIIRPAKVRDLAKIAAIINLEASASRCPQIIENREIVADDLLPIFIHCENTLRPFLVAVPSKDEFLDTSKWPSGSARVYEQFKKFKESQPTQEDGFIYGFAFITETRIGFMNSACPGARHSGLIRMVVHPDYRRRLIGSALLEKVLSLVDSCHYQMVDYHWQCDGPASIYERSPDRNTRQYSQVYIELFTAKKGDESYAWKSGLLDKYSFKCITRFDDMVKTDRNSDNQWLDLTIWEHKIKKGSKLPHVPASKYLAPKLRP